MAVISCIATAVLLLLAGALGYGLWRAQQERELTEAHVYAADMSLAQQAALADDLGKARALLDRYRPGSGREHLRGFEWRYLDWETRADYTANASSSPDAAFRMALSPDGRTLAVGRWNGAVELWDPALLRRTATLDENKGVAVVAFSPKGNLLAASGPGGTLRLWQIEPRRLVSELVHTNRAICLSFSPDAERLASFHADSGVWLWNLKSLQAERHYPGFPNRGVHGGPVCFSPDGRQLAAGHSSGHIRIIDWVTDTVVRDIAAHEQPLMCLAYSPDGKLLASGSGYSADDIRLWNPATGERVGALSGHRNWVSVLQFSEDGRQLFSGGADQTIGIWDVASRRLSRKLRGHEDEVFGLVVDSLRTNLLSGCKDGTLARWDLAEGQKHTLRFELPEKVHHPAFAAGGASVAALDQQGAVILWRPDEPNQPLAVDALGTNNAAMAAASVRGLLACATRGGPVRVWSLRPASLVANLEGHPGRVSGLRFSRREDFLLAFDNSYLATGYCTVWEATNWKRRFSGADTNGVSGATLSPDGRLLVMGSWDGRVSWWDMATAHRLAESKAHRDVVRGLDFSPDGTTLASSSDDGTVALWEVRTRRETAHWKASLNATMAVSFSPDGTRLATGLSGGYAARLWDLKTQRELVTLVAPGNMFWSLEFQSDGGALLCGSEDGYCYVWRPPPSTTLDAVPLHATSILK